jgi:AcrR family transcriptional regulator
MDRMSEPLFVPGDENPYVEAIVGAATELFSAKGYRGTSMRDLGDALGLHAGSLYVHIRSKEDVLYVIIDRISSVYERYMKEITSSDLPPVEQLREVARNTLTLIGENSQAAKVYFHEWKNLSPRRQQKIIARRELFHTSVRGIIRGCVKDGTFRPVDDKLAAYALESMFSWTYQWYSPSGPLSPTEVADSFMNFVIEGLTSRVENQ